MSNYIKDILGNDVYTNYMNGLAIGDHIFKWKDFLPVFSHYLQGGVFGHNKILMTEEDQKALDDFIETLKKTKKMSTKEVMGVEDKEVENNFYYFVPPEKNGET